MNGKRVLSRRVLGVGLCVVLAAGGCATVPKEAVDLSVTIGRDLASVHRAHRELAIRYYDRMEVEIGAFVDEVYRPFTIGNTITEFGLVEKITAGTRPDAEPDALDVMDVYVTEVMADIEEFRASLLTPLRQRRESVIREIDEAYAALQNAQAVVTGHLSSVRKVHEEQDALLAKAHLDGMRERFIESTTKLSDGIASAIARGRRGEERIDEAADALRKLLGTGEE